MILGTTTFTAVHVLLSLIGILSGLVVLFGLLTANPMNGWTLLFLATTLVTSVTGFLFSFRLASRRRSAWASCRFLSLP